MRLFGTLNTRSFIERTLLRGLGEAVSEQLAFLDSLCRNFSRIDSRQELQDRTSQERHFWLCSQEHFSVVHHPLLSSSPRKGSTITAVKKYKSDEGVELGMPLWDTVAPPGRCRLVGLKNQSAVAIDKPATERRIQLLILSYSETCSYNGPDASTL